MEKGLKLEVYRNNKLDWSTTEKELIINNLTCQMYDIAIKKTKTLKVKYSYNYSDLQVVSIRMKIDNFDGTTEKIEYRYINIPTKMSYLDYFKLIG